MKNITVNISEAKANLSRFAKRVKKGETIFLSERNIPFAQITPLPKTPEQLAVKRKKLIGSLKNKVKLVGDINSQFTDKELKEFYGN